MRLGSRSESIDDVGEVPYRPPGVFFFLAAPPLRKYVTSYYIVSSPRPMSDHLHPEWANVRFAVTGSWNCWMEGRETRTPRRSTLFGPTDRTSRFETPGGLLLGAGLTPEGWARLIGGDAGALANDLRELGNALGAGGDAIADLLAYDTDHAAMVAVLDRVLLARLDGGACDDPTIGAIQAALASEQVCDVGQLAAAVGLTDRTLHRVCHRVFGFGPKRLLKRQRFLRTLANVRDRLNQPLGHVLDEQYYDQAHFIRDFRAFMGISPKSYFDSPREVMRRAADERMRVVGASLQGLHR